MEATLDAYAEQVPDIGGDPERDRQAMIEAVERGGYTRAQSDSAKVKQFLRLWKSDEGREYFWNLWTTNLPEAPDPLSLVMSTLYEHVAQNDTEKWGKPSRGESLTATGMLIKLFVPAQTTKVLTGHLSAKVERPAAYDTDQPMTARTILPAGTTIAKPTGPTGADDEEGEDDGEDD